MKYSIQIQISLQPENENEAHDNAEAILIAEKLCKKIGSLFEKVDVDYTISKVENNQPLDEPIEQKPKAKPISHLIDGIRYTLDDTNHTATVVAHTKKYKGDIIIPQQISFNNLTYAVVAIDDWTFDGCIKLTSITLPETLTTIGEWAFLNCKALTSIRIPKSVTNIQYGAFGHCPALTNIVVDDNNPKYDSRDNCNAIVDTANDTIYMACTGTSIPATITTIAEGAFYDRPITSLYIPGNINKICSGACTFMKKLTEVTIAEGVKYIDNFVFAQCSQLKTITLPSTIEFLGRDVFRHDNKLRTILVPQNTKSHFCKLLPEEYHPLVQEQ